MKKKIIIIGAGILGASTAYHLSKTNTDVTLIDRNEPGQATDAATGIICPWLSKRRNKAWYHLAKNGAKIYPNMIKELEEAGEKETGCRPQAEGITGSRVFAECRTRVGMERYRAADAHVPGIGGAAIIAQYAPRGHPAGSWWMVAYST